MYHPVEQIERPEANGLVFVIETLQDEVFVGLYRFGVSFQDLGHRQQT